MTVSNEFAFIGWNNEDNHDKIWGYFYRPTVVPETYRWDTPTKEYGWNVVRFWARRGQKINFKPDVSGYELTKLRNQKEHKKNYVSISEAKLLEIWPTFIEEAQDKLVWDIVAGKVK